jgi:glycine dehydrogenase
MTAMYGIWHRPEGLKQIAKRLRFRTEALREELRNLNIATITHQFNFFDTVTIDCAASGFSSADFVLSEFHKHEMNLRKIDDNLISVSINETTTITDLADLIEVFAHLKGKTDEMGLGSYLQEQRFEDIVYRGLPAELNRKSDFMT